jgi:biopolymer transport protein ExbD
MGIIPTGKQLNITPLINYFYLLRLLIIFIYIFFSKIAKTLSSIDTREI